MQGARAHERFARAPPESRAPRGAFRRGRLMSASGAAASIRAPGTSRRSREAASEDVQRRIKVVCLRVGYKSGTIDEFIDRHAGDIARGGVHIKTKQPFPIDTAIRFEIHLADEKVVLAGAGRVVWKRDGPQAAGGRPAGMGVRFVKLDETSKDLVDRIATTRPDAGRAYEEGLAPSSAAPRKEGSLFPPAQAGQETPPTDEQTVVTTLDDVVAEEKRAASEGVTVVTTLDEVVAEEKRAASERPRPPKRSQRDERTPMERVPGQLAKAVQKAVGATEALSHPIWSEAISVFEGRPPATALRVEGSSSKSLESTRAPTRRTTMVSALKAVVAAVAVALSFLASGHVSVRQPRIAADVNRSATLLRFVDAALRK